MTPRRTAMLVALAVVFGPSTSWGQDAADLLAQGVRAYQDLEFDAAAAIFRRVLLPGPDEQTSEEVQADALAYLGATELFRGRRISAITAFRRLVRLDPRYRPDELVFPPEITNLFDETRRQTRATRIEVPGEAEVRVGIDRYRIRLLASSLHDVNAEVQRRDGTRVRILYSGPISDSLDLGWDGRDADGALVEPGRFVIAAASLDTDGDVATLAQQPLELALVVIDTLPHPPVIQESAFLPESRPTGPGIEALVGGLLIGTAVAALPSVVISGSDATEARFAVGGAIGLGGLIGFLARRPGQALPANAAANTRVRREWAEQLRSVQQENARRQADVRLRITSGRPLPDERRP